jgi:hypothetical protein
MTEHEIPTSCPSCGETRNVTVDAQGYADWQGGALIQDALPALSADEREQLITGYDTDCWNTMWADEDEDTDGS